VKHEQTVRDWLDGLTRPVGIFAFNDECALELEDHVRVSGRRIPEDVAILGADNAETLCEMAHPPLSSVDLGFEEMGRHAAEILDRWLAGKVPPREPVLLPPLYVVTRQSTDLVAVSDTAVAQAVAFIKEHAREPLRVGDLLKVVPVSRRELEKRFRAHLGRTIRGEIERARFERAKVLLLGTSLPMATVAERSGFASPQHFCKVFRRAFGQTPTQFRHSKGR
jgi:LacI family transcriptional regulator